MDHIFSRWSFPVAVPGVRRMVESVERIANSSAHAVPANMALRPIPFARQSLLTLPERYYLAHGHGLRSPP